MPRKSIKTAAAPQQPWTANEISVLRRLFANNTNAQLAERLARSLKSVAHKAASLGLQKSLKHRCTVSRTSALANVPSSEVMAERGRAGGMIGGKVRRERLSSEEMKRIASTAAKARWNKKRD